MRTPLGMSVKPVAAPLLCAAMLFLLLSSALCHAQTPCPSSLTITSVTPSTWAAGQTYNIIISGTGFLGSTPYNPSCVQGNTSVTLTNTGSVTLSNVSYVSATEITATVTPAASDPAQTACVTVDYVSVFVIRQTASANSSACPANTNSSATYAVQITGCPTPTVTTVTPSTWLAGETYKDVEITGTNFVTKDDAAKTGCPVTQVAVTASTGNVTVSNIRVNNKTEIKVTVKPDDDDPTEPATVTAGTAPNTGTAAAQINGLPPAKIEWNGSDISGTTQSAVVGQKIELKAEPKTPLAAGFTISKSAWQIDPTNIGNLNEPAGNSGFTTDDAVLDKPDATFYWLVPNNGLNANYTYCAKVPSGREICPKTTKATATFNVGGPTFTNLFTCGGFITAPGCSGDGPLAGVVIAIGPKLEIGNPLMDIEGIVFTASDDSSSPPGKFSFAQLLSKLNVEYHYVSGGSCQINGSGLDKGYPYPSLQGSPNSADDSPGALLFAEDSEVTYSFGATMYLLWKSTGTSDSIPVPLGSVGWGWFGDAVRDKSMKTWSIKDDSGSVGAAGPFAPNPTYPQWSEVYVPPKPSPCIHSYER
ncbi:MAG: IPT/TIG domain-containing protein [Terracidiphilus sp.]